MYIGLETYQSIDEDDKGIYTSDLREGNICFSLNGNRFLYKFQIDYIPHCNKFLLTKTIILNDLIFRFSSFYLSEGNYYIDAENTRVLIKYISAGIIGIVTINVDS